MAARKGLTPAEVKAAKQKKIAIGGAVLLVAILAFEVPKVMKLMNQKPATASAAPAATTTPDPSAPAAAAPVAGAPTAAAATGGATGVDSLVVNADLSPAPLDGQLAQISATFTSKDPFKQQLATSSAPPDTAGAPTAPAKKAVVGIVPGDASGGGDTSTTTAPKTPAAAPVSAVISVNGVDSSVGVASTFPVDAPLFVLKSLTAKTAQIAIAGGSLSSGAPAITLKLGVPLTLMNTADGTRYKLVLVSASATAVAATAPATTTPTATTTTPTTTTG